jgi:serine/threonine-protein kinase
MSLNVGSRLGHYDVTALIGEGGMGQVYQATDTKLNRQVALKILPEAFASDPDRLARFQREAQVLASLNHPNIAQIHGLEDSEGTKALVLELVEGPTLADRIAQGPIPIDEALPIAKQIAEALEAAHEAGVIHRDLKPANIKVKDDGTVKVLDFGLAKAFQPDASDASMSMSPTISLTAAATQMGMVIGTAAYMAPEQAKGKIVDKRADVWAFGAVFYEMLTGRKPFTGDDVSTTLARVIEREPDWDALPSNLSPVLCTYLRRCLAKEPKQRIPDIADMRLAMEGAFETTSVGTRIESGDEPTLSLWQRPLPAAMAALVLVAATGLAVWTVTRPDVIPAEPVRFVIGPSEIVSLGGHPSLPDLVISPDGSRIAYNTLPSSGNNAQLHLRALSQLEGVPVRGGENGSGSFFSPNGEWIGFVEDSSTLLKVSILGGSPVSLAVSTSAILGASWGADDQIIFGTNGAGLFRVSGAGGDAEPLTILGREPGDVSYTWPVVIPGREAVVFVISTGGPLATGQLAVLDIPTGEVTRLGIAGTSPRYISTGHLVYAADDGSVRAVPFDTTSLEVAGSPVPLIEGVTVKDTGAANFSISDTGRLVYTTGAGLINQRSLVWVDREGREEPIALPPGRYVYPRISPDGNRVALDDRGGDGGIWIWDLAQETFSRLIVGDRGGTYALWTSDGEHIAHEIGGDIYLKASNNTGNPQLLAEDIASEGSGAPSPYFFGPDETTLVFRDQANLETDDDLAMISIEGGEVIWRLATQSRERNAELSTDGRWMVYQSDESGEFEIYVRPFPQVEEDQVHVSNNGGVYPVWSRDGRELFYVEPGNPSRLISVSVTTEATSETFTFGNRVPVVDLSDLIGEGRSYDVSPDGQRFLVLKVARGDATDFAEINVVLNWHQELLERVPLP